MSEVHRYSVVKMLSAMGNAISYSPHGPEVVMADAFDALRQQLADVSNERDELKAESFEPLYNAVIDERDAPQLKLNASQARNTQAEELFRLVLHCDFEMLGAPVSDIESFLAQSAPATDEQGAEPVCNNEREEAGLPTNPDCGACGRGACIDR